MKVFILTPRICPARYNYYIELSKYADLSLVSELRPENKIFDKTLKNTKLTFNLEYLDGFIIKDYLSFSLRVIRYLSGNLNRIIIIEQYSSPTSMLAILYLKFKKKPFFLNADGGFINNEETLLKKKIKSFFISCANFYFSSSDATSKYLEYYGAKKDNIYNYKISSTSHINKDDVFLSYEDYMIYKSELFKNDKPIITYIGRFVHEKGFDLFIDLIVKGNVDANYLMIGGKLDSSNLVIELAKLNNLKVIDHVSISEVYKYLKISDLHVIPSRNDVWNYTLVEAYRMGTRVISSDKVGAAQELLFDRENFMFHYDDFNRMLEVINFSLITNKNDLEINYYREISEEYSSENMAKSIYVVLLSKMVEQQL
jgi:glycosyltransferase involved in cell wall biosynthesis